MSMNSRHSSVRDVYQVLSLRQFNCNDGYLTSDHTPDHTVHIHTSAYSHSLAVVTLWIFTLVPDHTGTHDCSIVSSTFDRYTSSAQQT